MNSVLTVTKKHKQKIQEKKMAKADFSSLKGAHHEFANMTRFRGDPDEDPREFLYRFETISNCFDVSGVMRLVAFPLVLTDQALMWFHGLDPSQKDSIDKVIDLFRDKYTPKRDNWGSIQDLMSRRQGPNETVHSFAGDLRKKCHLLKRSEYDLMERFVLGLRDPLLRYVMEKCPANFDDAVSHATAAESLEKFHSQRPGVNTVHQGSQETSMIVEMLKVMSERLGTVEANQNRGPRPDVKNYSRHTDGAT